jgi:hypothetical protein
MRRRTRPEPVVRFGWGPHRGWDEDEDPWPYFCRRDLGLPPGGLLLVEGGDQMIIERVYEEGLVKEWHGNQI